MSDQVSIRLAVVGGNQFRNELRTAGAEGARSMQQIATASRSVSPAFQAVAIQASGMFSTMAGGNSALAGLAGAFSQAAISGGAFGIAAGVVVTALGAMVPLLISGRQSAAEMAAELTSLQGSTGSVTGAVSALEAVQRQYTAAIEASGGASGVAAGAVVANSKAEFEARKQVLEVEMELLRIRGAEQAANLRNLEDVLRMEGEAAAARDASMYVDRDRVQNPTGFANRRQMGAQQPTPAFDDFLERNETTRLAIKKLRAEAQLTNLTIKETDEILNSTFKDISTGAPAKLDAVKTGAAGAGGGSGGGAAINKSVEEGKRIFDETRTAAERYSAQLAKLSDLLAKGAIDQDTYNRKAAQLSAEFESSNKFAQGVASQVQSSFSALFAAIVDGGGKAGDVIEGLGKKLLAMALEQSVFQLLSKLMPSTFGADGFIPLLANANGNAFGGGRVIPFASGGVVTGPTTFPMRGATGLMGEAGPEAIMPLTRVGGKLGVRAAGGGGGGGTVVNVINNSGQAAQEERERGPNGEEMVRVIVGDQLAKGRHDGAMGRFGARPSKVSRG